MPCTLSLMFCSLKTTMLLVSHVPFKDVFKWVLEESSRCDWNKTTESLSEAASSWGKAGHWVSAPGIMARDSFHKRENQILENNKPKPNKQIKNLLSNVTEGVRISEPGFKYRSFDYRLGVLSYHYIKQS